LLGEAIRRWPNAGEAAAEFLNSLTFRREMLAAFDHP
jgi:hypothetical protein